MEACIALCGLFVRARCHVAVYGQITRGGRRDEHFALARPVQPTRHTFSASVHVLRQSRRLRARGSRRRRTGVGSIALTRAPTHHVPPRAPIDRVAPLLTPVHHQYSLRLAIKITFGCRTIRSRAARSRWEARSLSRRRRAAARREVQCGAAQPLFRAAPRPRAPRRRSSSSTR